MLLKGGGAEGKACMHYLCGNRSEYLPVHSSPLLPDQVLVAAPSNVAVDQLAQKISQTGLKVCRGRGGNYGAHKGERGVC